MGRAVPWSEVQARGANEAAPGEVPDEFAKHVGGGGSASADAPAIDQPSREPIDEYSDESNAEPSGEASDEPSDEPVADPVDELGDGARDRN
jgi:hypothetical protein